jgi:uracil-DNA glycosylase
MTHPWKDMKWWNSGERQVVEEKIDDLQAKGVVCNPAKSALYKALSATKEEDCRVCIVGQDPYPNAAFATGVAFSIPSSIPSESWPATLRIVLGEYRSDLGYDLPSNGDLSRWTSQGVLLWNAIPSVQSNLPLSNDWDEWSYLTREVIQRLSERGVVFAFLGAVARRYERDVDLTRNRVIITGHPSPRGNNHSKTPFTGSRLFSTINARLSELKLPPIDWSLSHDPSKSTIQRPDLGRGNILPNVNRVDLGGLPRPRLPRRIESTFLLEDDNGTEGKTS